MMRVIKNTLQGVIEDVPRCPDCYRKMMKVGHPRAFGTQKWKCKSRKCGYGWG